MPSTPPDAPTSFEARVAHLDLQPWLSRHGRSPGPGLSTPFLRALALPAVVHLPLLLLVALVLDLTSSHGIHTAGEGLVLVVLPVVEAVACLCLAAAFARRRGRHALTAGVRAQSRLLGYLLTVLSGFGLGAGAWEPVAVSAAALLSMVAVRAPVEASPDGRAWWDA